MNWEVTVNELIQDYAISRGQHQKLAEACELVGECAIIDASLALGEAIAGFIFWIERSEAIERGAFWNNVRPGERAWQYEIG